MAFPLGQAPPIFEKNVSTLKGFVNRTKILAPSPVFVLVGVQAGGIRIIRLGGIILF
jgi:hypothetical protein